MTIWEIITICPLWVLAAAVIAAPLIPIANRHGKEWAKNLVLLVAVVGATAVVWFVTNFAIEKDDVPEGYAVMSEV